MSSRERLAGADAMLRRRMRAALPQAMKDHDRIAVSALRSTLGVLANAEAVPVGSTAYRPVLGVGASEVPRHELTDLEVVAIVRAEAEQREAAATTYDELGDAPRAERLRAEAEVIRAFLD